MMKKNDIEDGLRNDEKFKNRVFEVATKQLASDYPRKRGDITKWANATTNQVFGKDIKALNSPVYFSYIKFAKDTQNNIYGIIGGISQFHSKYNSDIEFWDLDKNSQKEAAKKMKTENLDWYTDSVIIIRNNDDQSREEAVNNEKDLQDKFELFG